MQCFYFLCLNADLDWAKHGICGRGVLLDLVNYYEEGGHTLPYDPWTTHGFTVAELEAVAKKQGVVVPVFVFYCTGTLPDSDLPVAALFLRYHGRALTGEWVDHPVTFRYVTLRFFLESSSEPCSLAQLHGLDASARLASAGSLSLRFQTLERHR